MPVLGSSGLLLEPTLRYARHAVLLCIHGLRTPNEGINQRNLKIWADMLRPYLKIWEWELIFGRAVKAISSPGVRSP